MASKLRKGGDGRFVITNITPGDSFIVARGFKVRELLTDNGPVATTTAPTLVVGNVPAVNQSGVLVVAGVAGAASTVFSIGGVASATQIALNNTVLQTVALILSQFALGGPQYTALLNAGWIITAHPTLTDRVVFTGSPAKTSTAPVIVTTSLTVQTLTPTVTVTGVANNTFMSSQSMTTTASTVTDLTTNLSTALKTGRSQNNVDSLSVTFSTTSTSAGYYLVNGVQSPLIASGQTATQIATTLATMKIPGYTLSGTNPLVISNQSAGAGVPQPTFGSYAPQAVASTTWTTAFTPEDTVCYVATDLNAQLGGHAIYAVLQKLN